MKKNKIIGILIILAICISAFIGYANFTKVKGYYETVNGLSWYYVVSDGKAINVYLSSGTPGETLTIPSTLGGYPVTEIKCGSTSTSRRYNLLGSTANNTTITKVIIPDTVTTIGMNAFRGLNALTSIDIPASVTTISDYAFYSNIGIKEVNFAENNNLSNLGNYAFYSCSALKEVDFAGNNKISTIGNYTFYGCSSLTQIDIPTSVISIGERAFYNCAQLQEMELPEEVTSIGNYAFYGCKKLNKINMPNKLQTIGNNAFYNCTSLSENLEFPDTLQSIGSSAFYNNTSLTGVKFNNGLKTINSSSFDHCSSLKGDIIIPDSVTTLGQYVFRDCTSLDGIISVGKGVTSIQSYAFQNCINVKKVILGENTTKIEYYAFDGFTDIWVNTVKENVSLNDNFSGKNTAKIHWLDETHRLDISALPGIKIINTDTNAEILSGDYECDISVNFKVQVDDGYNYEDLKLIIVKNNDFNNSQAYDVNASETYKIDRLITDNLIIVQAIKQGSDLSLRTFITEINRNKVSDSREPIYTSVNGEAAYKHTKFPLTVKKSDYITYKIRVYNEGTVATTANKVSMFIPEGLEFVPENKTNLKYGWSKSEDNTKVTTSYLSNKAIKEYTGLGTPSYEDLEVVLQVKNSTIKDEDIRIVTLAQIDEMPTTDNDSVPASVKTNVESTYKNEESIASNGSSYIKGNEDDEDFENVIIKGKIKVDYTIRITKIDADTNELLSGAKFNLLNENGEVIATSVTSDEGILDFGMVSSYGEGQDIYYIEEAGSPEGYIIIEKTKIKVMVTKTITDVEQGTYSVSVVCEALDYYLDTTRYEYTPIYTLEQLQKIGSGETVTIDGVNYEYNINTNYKLMADIDASSIVWNPIDKNMKCIIDGNGHKISNLTINKTEGSDISEIGLFRNFSGVIENLELENININMLHINKDAASISNYSGVGAFAGVMQEGTIRNCKVSGNIVAATDNIGAFIGHTAEGNIVKIQNCVNNANVTGIESIYDTTDEDGNEITITSKSSNVGGLVGCALGSLSVTDCTNNGEITANNYNVGGVVGYVKSTKYQEVSITADFDESEKIINLVIENIRTKGKYELQIETIDAKTLGIIEGASYTILDKDRNPLPGCDNVQLKDGKLKIAIIDIENLGIDTYYIQENSTIPGYGKLTGTIKLQVRRYWDDQTGKFKVSVETGSLSENEFAEDKPVKSDDNIPSQTGSIFTKVNIDDEAVFANKAEFVGCVNNGTINSTYMNAAGIVGTAHCFVRLEDCENTGKISAIGYGKAGGIISEINTWKSNKTVEITNCKNSGTVETEGSTGSAGGIVAHSLCDIKVINCENTAEIKAGRSSSAAGIVADANGIIVIDSCKNEGHIIATFENTTPDINCMAAGILAKNSGATYGYFGDIRISIDDSNVKINNCINTGDIDSACHTGGIVAQSVAKELVISNCTVKDNYIHDVAAGDKGGIAGFVSAEEAEISNCIVDNVDLNRDSDYIGNTYGDTAGIVGNYSRYAGSTLTNLDLIKISNCSVTNSNIKTKGKETAGILAGSYSSGAITDIVITDCNVENCEIQNEHDVNTYGGSAGILGATYEAGNIYIDNNLIKENLLTVGSTEENRGNDYNVAGVLAIAWSSGKVTISNNDVIDCTIINNGCTTDGCANAAGIVGEMAVNMYSATEKFGEITNCNVIGTNISTISGNLAGVLGVGYQSSDELYYRITNCKVEGYNDKKSIFRSSSQDTSNGITAGIAGFIFSSVEMENCSINNLELYGTASNTTGILGEGYHHTTMKNCKTSNSKIYSTGRYSNNACVSGIVGTIADTVYIDNCDVENTEITGPQAGNVVGILGTSYGSYEKNIKNCDVLNTVITGEALYTTHRSNSTVAGLTGYYGNSLNLENDNVIGCTINGKGCITTGGAAVGTTLSAKNVTIKDTTITETGLNNGETSTRSIGGLSGYASYFSGENIKIDNVDIDGKVSSVGGIIGVTSTLQKLEKITVNDLTINNKTDQNMKFGSVGGLIGDVTSGNLNVKECYVSNSNLAASSNNIGGFFGTVNCQMGISDCKVDNVEIENKNSIVTQYPGNVGGFIGTDISSSSQDITIENSSVENSSLKIEGTAIEVVHAGGIIGYSDNIKLNNADVKTTNILNKSNGMTGGLFGMTAHIVTDTSEYSAIAEVENSDVLNCANITGNGHVGGMLGFGKLISKSGKVENGTIKGTSDFSDVGEVIGNRLVGSDITNVSTKDVVIEEFEEEIAIIDEVSEEIVEDKEEVSTDESLEEEIEGESI